MKITKSAFSKAIASNLSTGNRIGSGKVIKALQKAGIDPRFKGEVKEHQLRAAFDSLKQEGLLKEKMKNAGMYAFKETVQKAATAEASPELSKERQLAIAKMHLHERMKEEDDKKQRISEALGGSGKLGQKNAASQKPASHGVQQVQRASLSFGNLGQKGVSEKVGGSSRPLSAAQLIERTERPASSAKADVESRQEEEKKSVSLPKFERPAPPPDMFGPDE